MSEPLPPVEHAADAMKRAAEAIREMRRIPKGETAIQARARACAAIAAQRELAEAAHRTMTDAIAAKRVSNGSGNGLGTRDDGSEHHWLSTRDFPSLAKAIVPFVKELITEAVAECLRDGGTWQKEVMYQPNQVVTSDGTLWICKQVNANAKPPGDCWRQLHRTIGRK